MMVSGKKCFKEAGISFNWREITSYELNIKSMALELDDRDMIVIRF